jgi:hypothetical protein
VPEPAGERDLAERLAGGGLVLTIASRIRSCTAAAMSPHILRPLTGGA